MSVTTFEITNSVAYITLNRPEKRNALNDSLVAALKADLARSAAEDSVCAVVIKGAGTDFCSGADLSVLQKIAEGSILDNLADAESLGDLFNQIRTLPIPVIAAVHGRAFAGGCGLATGCDVVLASKSALFGYPEVKIGFVPAMVTAILRRNVSEKRAFELLTRGFEFDTTTAEIFGLVNEVFDDSNFEESVKTYAEGYGKLSRSAVSLTKRLLYQMDGQNFGDAMQSGATINTIARMTDDCQNGIAKFLKK
jgi:methylglutaconyl-CoA hydratase